MFSIDSFAQTCKAAMAASTDQQAAASRVLREAINTHGREEIISSLTAAIPEGASIGEMIVHTSPELTVLFARVPPRFQSGIHNHTVFACVGQLAGRESHTIYVESEAGLEVVDRKINPALGVLRLPADIIHSIANPDDEVACSLHLYGGDFGAIEAERSLWDEVSHEEQSFSFPALLAQSIKAMKKAENSAGLDALVEAIPQAKAAVEASQIPA